MIDTASKVCLVQEVMKVNHEQHIIYCYNIYIIHLKTGNLRILSHIDIFLSLQFVFDSAHSLVPQAQQPPASGAAVGDGDAGAEAGESTDEAVGGSRATAEGGAPPPSTIPEHLAAAILSTNVR